MIYLPQKIKLFGQTWHIRAARPNELSECWGECRPDQLEVVVNPNQHTGMLAHTLLHEIIHCMEQKLQLNMTEQQVDLLALAMLDLIRNQPQFFEQFGDQHGE